jgi:hypothetical protein
MQSAELGNLFGGSSKMDEKRRKRRTVSQTVRRSENRMARNFAG